jgi:hypothetical protein
MDEAELIRDAAERHTRPATPQFFERFWHEAEQRQRRAARRWRVAALGCAALAAAATCAAGVMASSRGPTDATVDQTWSCLAANTAGTRVGLHASTATPRSEAYLQVSWLQPIGYRVLGSAALRFGTSERTVAWDAHVCKRAATMLVFGSRGLSADNVYTSHFLGGFTGSCPTASRVLIRAHVRFAHGTPVSAKIIVADAATQKPRAYIQWSTARIADWTHTGCEITAY